MEIRPTARSSDLVVQKIADETLVYDLKSHKAKCLNDTSATVWRLCDGTRSAMDISIELSAKFKTNVDESFVLLAFDSLQKEELLDIGDSVAFSFDRVSRREVIKKVGFAAIVALPIVSSVVAPSAANASSHAPPTPPCSSSNQQDCTCGPSGPSCQGACDASLQAYCAPFGGTAKSCVPNQLQCQSGGPCNAVNAAGKCCVHNGSGVFGMPNWMQSNC